MTAGISAGHGSRRPATGTARRPAQRRTGGVRGAVLVGVSLLDDIALAALAHKRWSAVGALVLGPKLALLGCVLGLAAGATWIALYDTGARGQHKRARRAAAASPADPAADLSAAAPTKR